MWSIVVRVLYGLYFSCSFLSVDVSFSFLFSSMLWLSLTNFIWWRQLKIQLEKSTKIYIYIFWYCYFTLSSTNTYTIPTILITDTFICKPINIFIFVIPYKPRLSHSSYFPPPSIYWKGNFLNKTKVSSHPFGPEKDPTSHTSWPYFSTAAIWISGTSSWGDPN